MKYVMVLLVPFYRVDKDTIACESAFAEHLRELLPRIEPWGDEIVIHSPVMSEESYQQSKHHLSVIHCEQEKIHYVEGFPEKTSRLKYCLQAPFRFWPRIWQVVKGANVVHSSVSKDPMMLFTIMSLVFAVFQGKKTLLAMDIDHRQSAKMLYKTGKFSRKSYYLSQYVYNPLVSLQLRFAVRYCKLLMLKGQALVNDYGKGKAHVKNFYDTVHDASFILSPEELAHKQQRLDGPLDELKCVYFGRLVAYKGIADMIRSVKLANQDLVGSEQRVSLSIIGGGSEKAVLKALVEAEGLSDTVRFIDPLTYGSELFNELKQYDLLLAAPHSEDTPRSVFDSMACGLPIVAYDTYYYKDLETTGTVKTVSWLSPPAMSSALVDLLKQPAPLKPMTQACRDFALNNTQAIWLNKRLEWTKEFLGD